MIFLCIHQWYHLLNPASVQAVVWAAHHHYNQAQTQAVCLLCIHQWYHLLNPAAVQAVVWAVHHHYNQAQTQAVCLLCIHQLCHLLKLPANQAVVLPAHHHYYQGHEFQVAARKVINTFIINATSCTVINRAATT